MTTDRAELLRAAAALAQTWGNAAGDPSASLVEVMDEAADELDRLRAENERLREALWLTRDDVAKAVQSAWNAVLADSGCVPDDFDLYYDHVQGSYATLDAGRSGWVTLIADALNAGLAASLSETGGE